MLHRSIMQIMISNDHHSFHECLVILTQEPMPACFSATLSRVCGSAPSLKNRCGRIRTDFTTENKYVRCTVAAYPFAESFGLNCSGLILNLPRRSPISSRNSRMLSSLTSCIRTRMDAPTGKRRCRILLITGGATSSARDNAASFFRFNVLIKASSNRSRSTLNSAVNVVSVICFVVVDCRAFCRECRHVHCGGGCAG